FGLPYPVFCLLLQVQYLIRSKILIAADNDLFAFEQPIKNLVEFGIFSSQANVALFCHSCGRIDYKHPVSSGVFEEPSCGEEKARFLLPQLQTDPDTLAATDAGWTLSGERHIHFEAAVGNRRVALGDLEFVVLTAKRKLAAQSYTDPWQVKFVNGHPHLEFV